MSLLLNMLSRLVITLLPRSKHLLISWLQSKKQPLYEWNTYRKFQLINEEWIIELENHHLAVTIGIIVSAKYSGIWVWGKNMACYSIYFCVVCLTVCMFPCITCIIKNMVILLTCWGTCVCHCQCLLQDTGTQISSTEVAPRSTVSWKRDKSSRSN